jgi:hypothetical protein
VSDDHRPGEPERIEKGGDVGSQIVDGVPLLRLV